MSAFESTPQPLHHAIYVAPPPVGCQARDEVLHAPHESLLKSGLHQRPPLERILGDWLECRGN